MSGDTAAGSIILSPTPLSPSDQEWITSRVPHPATCLNLASLRRLGLAGAARALRGSKPAAVIVTGRDPELSVFRDTLLLAAAAASATSRRFQPIEAQADSLRTSDVFLAFCRICASLAGGIWATVHVLLSLATISVLKQAAIQTFIKPSRCLYLKPTMMFGLQIGGAVGHVAGVANALCRSGQEIRLQTMNSQPLLNSSINQIIAPPPPGTAYPHEMNLFRYSRIFLGLASRQVEEFSPDYCYQRYSLNDMTGIMLRHRFGIPLILEFNGSETWIQRHWGRPLRMQRISELIERANLRLADLVVVVSEEVRKQVCALGIPQDKVFFYPNCIDPSLFDPGRFNQTETLRIREELGVPVQSMLFTFVGTFGRWHGTDILAAAIRRLIDQESSLLESRQIHFLLVGDGQFGPRVRAILGSDLGAPYVTLAGYRPQAETPGILAASDVCLAPHVPNPDGTPFFGSPTKLFEYMAMGKTTVSSDLDQIGWVLRGWQPGEPPPDIRIRPSETAILVDPGKVEALIEGIRSAASLSPADRERMGRTARSLVLRSYTWDKNVSAVMNRFESLVAHDPLSP